MIKLLEKVRIPHVFIFLSGIILFSSLLTFVIPSGTYQRTRKNIGGVERTMVIPGTYEGIPKHYSVKGLVWGEDIEGKASPTSILGLFSAIPKGMNQAASLIFFIFIIGAVFNVIQHTGTINVFIYRLWRRFRHSPTLLTFILYFGIALASTFMGMGSEFIPMIPIFLILAKEMGYDRVFGIAILLLGMQVGWATAITNPFTVQIAQQIAEVPVGSGIWLRVMMFIVFSAAGFLFLMRYGKNVKKDRSNSFMADDPFTIDKDFELTEKPLQRQHILIAITALVLFGLILFAVQTMGWGLIEMTGGFFIVGLCTILISRMSGEESMKAFIKGLEIMIVPALIVGFARGIQVVMFEGQIIDTILYHTDMILQELPTLVAVEGMYVFQTVMNFFIPSASGQALVSMPLMVPLGDLLDITRQTTVLAFTMGDGFSNMIIPTNGVLMAILGIAMVPFEKWFKFAFPLYLFFALTSGLILALAVYIGY